MVTFRLVEETEQYLIYRYFPDGHEDEMHGIILIDKLNETVEIQKMAHNDFSHIVTVDEQNELRNSVITSGYQDTLRQPFFYTVRYSFPLFYIFPGNRKTRRTEVLRVSYVWTQRYLTITNLYSDCITR